MREWIPVSTSPKGRLALAAVREFGSRPFDQVTVSELAGAAGVTTGALYHHFDSKLGIYTFVRRDVETRLLDRMEGAGAAGRADDRAGRIRAALTVGFDFAVAKGFLRLLAAAAPSPRDDPLAEFLARLCLPAQPPIGQVMAAGWRAALLAVADGVGVADARAAVLELSPLLASAARTVSGPAQPPRRPIKRSAGRAAGR